MNVLVSGFGFLSSSAPQGLDRTSHFRSSLPAAAANIHSSLPTAAVMAVQKGDTRQWRVHCLEVRPDPYETYQIIAQKLGDGTTADEIAVLNQERDVVSACDVITLPPAKIEKLAVLEVPQKLPVEATKPTPEMPQESEAPAPPPEPLLRPEQPMLPHERQVNDQYHENLKQQIEEDRMQQLEELINEQLRMGSGEHGGFGGGGGGFGGGGGGVPAGGDPAHVIDATDDLKKRTRDLLMEEMHEPQPMKPEPPKVQELPVPKPPKAPEPSAPNPPLDEKPKKPEILGAPPEACECSN